jgi:hypothetical protein
MNIVWAGRRVPFLFLLLLITVFLSFSPWAGLNLQARSSPPGACVPLEEKDAPFAQALWKAYEVEGDGLLESAEANYVGALPAACPTIRRGAAAGLARLRLARASTNILFRIQLALAPASAGARMPILVFGAILMLAGIMRQITPRRGIRLKGFDVYGVIDPAAGSHFRDTLVGYSSFVQRVFSSDYARRIGIQLFFNDLSGESLSDATELERTLADVRDADSKVTLAIAISRGFRYLRRALERPRVEMSGTVWVQPSEARASAVLRDLASGEEIHVDGSSTDFELLPMNPFVAEKLIHLPAQNPRVPRSVRAEEFRDLSLQLRQLALVLACTIRYRESQSLPAGVRPASWRTICLTAAVLKDLI